ncbi:hypothetical protein [Deinococcus sp. Marseille-Q6407]|uniref:hypothetical protein n=1 Tax=Deinococcus sp. Marseille-Q6407 TaxID=2969223 RepID=UPI0021BE83FC|nr:hypothetical protein [Deinococcus sp. Marseille-Q6407]
MTKKPITAQFLAIAEGLASISERAEGELLRLAPHLQQLPTLETTGGTDPAAPEGPIRVGIGRGAYILGQCRILYGEKAFSLLAPGFREFEAQLMSGSAGDASTPRNQFYARRDEQLAASRARFEVEEHLNSLSQGEVENLAAAIRAGGRLKGLVRAK